MNTSHVYFAAVDADKFLDRCRAIERDYSYCGVRFYIPSHRFGQFDGIAKDSNLRRKMRPLGSYASHGLRALYSLVCKSLNVLCGLVQDSPVAVCSFNAIIKSFGKLNVAHQDSLRRGWQCETLMAKSDLDNFYGNVPHKLVYEAINWLIGVASAKLGPRKQVLCIPRAQWRERRSSQSFTRSYGSFLRNISKDRDQPYFQHMKTNSRTHHVLHMQHILPVVKFEINTVVLWFGAIALSWSHGLTQGSSLALGICLDAVVSSRLR